jgi:hypothetical protein
MPGLLTLESKLVEPSDFRRIKAVSFNCGEALDRELLFPDIDRSTYVSSTYNAHPWGHEYFRRLPEDVERALVDSNEECPVIDGWTWVRYTNTPGREGCPALFREADVRHMRYRNRAATVVDAASDFVDCIQAKFGADAYMYAAFVPKDLTAPHGDRLLSYELQWSAEPNNDPQTSRLLLVGLEPRPHEQGVDPPEWSQRPTMEIATMKYQGKGLSLTGLRTWAFPKS